MLQPSNISDTVQNVSGKRSGSQIPASHSKATSEQSVSEMLSDENYFLMQADDLEKDTM